MKKSSTKNVGKYFIPMLSAGLTISLLQSQEPVIRVTEIPFDSPEPHWEEPFSHDYLGLMRDKTVPVATGTSTVLAFYEDNSDTQPY